MLDCYNLDYPSASDGGVCTSKFPGRFHEIENRLLTHGHIVDDHARLINQIANGHEAWLGSGIGAASTMASS